MRGRRLYRWRGRLGIAVSLLFHSALFRFLVLRHVPFVFDESALLEGLDRDVVMGFLDKLAAADS